MNKHIALLSAAILAFPAALSAQSWAFWSLPSNCSGAVSGTLGSTTVTYSGLYNGVTDGTSACKNPLANAAYGVGDLTAYDYFGAQGGTAYSPRPDNESFIQLTEMAKLSDDQSAWVPIQMSTITFSQAVIDPYIAFVSVGNPQQGGSVTYTFANAFDVLSYNQPGVGTAPYWGSGTYTVSPDGLSLTGVEFSGVIQFKGTFESLTFGVSSNEFWHGFTVGAASTTVPEPASYTLLGAGLLALGWTARRRRARA
jgi:hypothetical protein